MKDERDHVENEGYYTWADTKCNPASCINMKFKSDLLSKIVDRPPEISEIGLQFRGIGVIGIWWNRTADSIELLYETRR